MNLLHLKNFPIFQQLQLEEAFLRASDANFCIINEGTPAAIVMGISGKAEELIDTSEAKKAAIPLIKRFSGGGTVIVDEETLFVTFICHKELHGFACYPEAIMAWSAEFYTSALQLNDFALKENDYVIGKRKCGGNAQYIKKERFLHHTSFLWDFKEQHMQTLLHPKKTPSYREGRSHVDFLCKLRDYLPSKEHFVQVIKAELHRRYATQEISLKEAQKILHMPHRSATQFME